MPALAPEVLALLRCPLTMQPLQAAPAAVLERLPARLEGGLLREDGSVVYPIRDGLPALLPEEAIVINTAK